MLSFDNIIIIIIIILIMVIITQTLKHAKPDRRISYLSIRNEAGGSSGRGAGGVQLFVLQGKHSGSGWQSEDQVVEWHSERHH